MTQEEYNIALAKHQADIAKYSSYGPTSKLVPQLQAAFNQNVTTPFQNQQLAENATGYQNIYNQAKSAYDPAMIQKFFDVSGRNLNQAAANTGAYVARQAGAHSTNMLNPSGFILGGISQSQAPYAQQRGQLEATGAQAQQSGAANLAQMMYTLQRAKQGDAQAAAQLQLQWAQLQEQQRQFQQQMEANQPGLFDYLGMGAKAAGAIWGA
jgi:hypothetical protein